MTVSDGRVTLANLVITDNLDGSYTLERDTSVTTPSATTSANYSAISHYPHVVVLARWLSEGRAVSHEVRRGGGFHIERKPDGWTVTVWPEALDAARAWQLDSGGEWS